MTDQPAPLKRIRLAPTPLTPLPSNEEGAVAPPICSTVETNSGTAAATTTTSSGDSKKVRFSAVNDDAGGEATVTGQGCDNSGEPENELTLIDSNEAVAFVFLCPNGKVVHEFHPSMTHQIYDDEVIAGYSGLKITVFFTVTLDCYVEVRYNGEFHPAQGSLSLFVVAFLCHSCLPCRSHSVGLILLWLVT